MDQPTEKKSVTFEELKHLYQWVVNGVEAVTQGRAFATTYRDSYIKYSKWDIDHAFLSKHRVTGEYHYENVHPLALATTLLINAENEGQCLSGLRLIKQAIEGLDQE